MIKRWIWDKTTEFHIYYWVIQHIYVYQLRSSALLVFHPISDVSISIETVALIGLSKWSAVSCCINYSGIKSRECVVLVISITPVFWILHSMMTLTNQDKDEGADFERKASNLDAKERRKSIRAISKTKDMANQEFGNHPQPTTTWSAEKTTVVDDRQS